MTSYVIGDRRGLIAITYSAGLLNAFAAAVPREDGFIDEGLGGFNGSWFEQSLFNNFTPLDGTQWLKFDFGSAIVIDEAKYWQGNNTTNAGVWKWQGSNDNSVWTDIGSSFTLAGSVLPGYANYFVQNHFELNGNTIAYRYYRLLGVSGNCVDTAYCLELEFKQQAELGRTDIIVSHFLSQNDGNSTIQRTPALEVISSDAALCFGMQRYVAVEGGDANGTRQTQFHLDLSDVNAPDLGAPPIVVLQPTGWASSLGTEGGPHLKKITQGPNAGRIICVYYANDAPSQDYADSTGYHNLWMRYSDDDGQTWSVKERIIQVGVAPYASMDFIATGSNGDFVELPADDPNAPGRLLVPVWTFSGKGAVYSDDYGATWAISALTALSGSENTLAYRPDGVLLMTIRSDADVRYKLFSTDGGLTWGGGGLVGFTEQSNCNWSSLQIDLTGVYSPQGVILLAGPTGSSPSTRNQFRIKRSLDGGVTWPDEYAPMEVDLAAAGYSSMRLLNETTLLLAYETWLTGFNDDSFLRLKVIDLTEVFPGFGGQFNVVAYGAVEGDDDDNAETNTDAFRDCAAALEANNGGTYVIPDGIYVLGKEDFAGTTGLGYAYRGYASCPISNCTDPVVVEMDGAVLKMRAGLHFGSFDPTTGDPMGSIQTGADFRGILENFFSFIDNASVTMNGDFEIDGNIGAMVIGGQFGDVGIQLPATGIQAIGNDEFTITSDNYSVHDCGLDNIWISYPDLNSGSPLKPHIIGAGDIYNSGRNNWSLLSGNSITINGGTGRDAGQNGAVLSPPRSGIDIEMESTFLQNITLNDMVLSGNYGPAVVSDAHGAKYITGNRLTIEASLTSWAMWPTEDYWTLNDSLVKGPCIYFGNYFAANDTTFTKVGSYYGERTFIGNGGVGIVFTRDTFIGNVPGLDYDFTPSNPPDSLATYIDCTFINVWPKGKFYGTNTLIYDSGAGDWPRTEADYVFNFGVLNDNGVIIGLANTVLPKIIGGWRRGLEFHVQSGVYSLPVEYTGYQWYKNGAAIAGATGETYKPSRSDKGASFNFVESVSFSGSTMQTSSDTVVLTQGKLTGYNINPGRP